jgi:hypothetical protein
MIQKKTFLLLMGTALILNSSLLFAQVSNTEPFEKLKVRGAVLVNYQVSKEPGIQIIDARNQHLVKATVKNNKLTIKHLKIKPNQNKQVEINLHGLALKEIVAKQTAVIKSEGVILSDTAKVCMTSASELQTTVQSAKLSVKLTSGSFAYLEGEAKSLKLKAKTGSKFRAHKANISNAIIKVATGGFVALNGETDVEGKVVTGGELKFYGKSNDKKIKRHTHGIIRQSEVDEL